jgi:Predicted membrane protein (DUF2306)
MTLAASIPIRQSRARAWFTRLAALIAVVALMAYGASAIEAGVVNYKAAHDPSLAQHRIAMQAAAEAGEPLGSFEEIAQHSSTLLAILAHISSPTYTFGKQGLSEALVHYAVMPQFNGVSLALHSIFSGTAMLFGALQFWPAFRTRYKKWHRGFGVAYMVVVQLSMVAAGVYLWRTPIDLIYDQFTFYVGLWILTIGVTLSLWMSIHALMKRRIAQHQAWMALNYGMLLTAPIQRFGWLAFGAATPEMRQLEANYAVTGVLIPLCLLFGYGLYTVNRWRQESRTEAATRKVAAQFVSHGRLGLWLSRGAIVAMLAAVFGTLFGFVHQDGMVAAHLAGELVPASVLQMDQAVLAETPVTRFIFVAASCIGLLAGIRWLQLGSQRDLRLSASHSFRRAGWVLSAATAAVGLALLQWAWQWGLPSFSAQHGGALHLFGGLTCLTFAGLLAWAIHHELDDWAWEWSWFNVACLIAKPSFLFLLPVLGYLGVPERFIETGHAYRLASYAEWSFVIVAAVVAVYSPVTHSKVAR